MGVRACWHPCVRGIGIGVLYRRTLAELRVSFQPESGPPKTHCYAKIAVCDVTQGRPVAGGGTELSQDPLEPRLARAHRARTSSYRPPTASGPLRPQHNTHAVTTNSWRELAVAPPQNALLVRDPSSSPSTSSVGSSVLGSRLRVGGVLDGPCSEFGERIAGRRGVIARSLTHSPILAVFFSYQSHGKGFEWQTALAVCPTMHPHPPRLRRWQQ